MVTLKFDDTYAPQNQALMGILKVNDNYAPQNLTFIIMFFEKLAILLHRRINP